MGEVATNPLCAVRYSEMRASDTHLTLPLFEWGFIDRLLARTGGNIWRSVRNARQPRALPGKRGRSEAPDHSETPVDCQAATIC